MKIRNLCFFPAKQLPLTITATTPASCDNDLARCLGVVMASDVEIYEPGGCARDCTHGLAVKLVDNDQHSDFQRDQNRACVAALSTYSIYLGNHGDIHEL